jgi:endogenous inhibitor of DNA gyrase (YacG/DUF329 family)
MAKSDPNTQAPPAMARPCPICGKPRQERWRPFCSKRCADIDLNRWFTGAYAVPAVEDESRPAEDEEAPPPGAAKR